MKVADKYAKQVSNLLMSIHRAEMLTIDLDERINDFLRVLRRSRWGGRFDARLSIVHARLDLENKHKPKLTVIQGGNEFLARRSRAVLTLIVTNEVNTNQKVG